MSRFRSMRELISALRPEGHYTIIAVEDRRSRVRLFAPHGGCIEPCTGTVVSELAGVEFDYYIFRGEMRRDCHANLHVRSTRFDEPSCERMISAAAAGLSVHGCSSAEPYVEVGGGNRDRAGALAALLSGEGYPVRPPAPRRGGSDPKNFINRCAGGGVQMEMSAGFRRILFPGFPHDSMRNPVELPRFISAVRGWLLSIERELPSPPRDTP